jgi:site-specific recombinase XerC
MSDSDQSKLRKWAVAAARQAGLEKEASEARRLSNFAQYWMWLVDAEDSQRGDEAA